MESKKASPSHDYTVQADQFAREMIPLVEDFFTAKAVLSDEATLDVTFSNGENFTVIFRKK